ncbi:MAG: hypothetical protein CVU09_03380 [Bacteroidetes bacterium HGW-Bacteroidetes-4]|jgi:hypothetical protein|nr:MAG: hypothetical protein CVU09_03380 [Bacteroidetes bacterium HGW-Bacteroidetes-4]
MGAVPVQWMTLFFACFSVTKNSAFTLLIVQGLLLPLFGGAIKNIQPKPMHILIPAFSYA